MEPQSSRTELERFQDRLQAVVDNPVAWQTWLKPLQPSLEGHTLRLEAPTEFHRRWVRDRFLPALQEATTTSFGESVTIVLDAAATEADEEDETEPLPPPATAAANGERTPLPDDGTLGPKYTFDNFVVGPSNRFAHAAAMAVAEQPGAHYNPLFIYGQAGLGKTHLLRAVGNHCRELGPNMVIRYVTSEEFFNEFINGIRRKRMDEFKARYRTIDVLLLDDVQFFQNREQILEEFFHTFNSLYEAGKQIVISSDRPPKHLSSLEDRLRSRFEWGLLTDIQPPDVETRLAILRKNAEFAPQAVPREVLEFIAAHVLDNIRELEGALTRVTAFGALTNRQITLEMAQTVLQDIVPQQVTRQLTADTIIDTVASCYGLSSSDMISPSRRQPLARSRQIAMYLCRELTDLSLPKVGQAFGGRDHTTVIHAVEKVKKLMQEDKHVFDEVTALSQKLRTS